MRYWIPSPEAAGTIIQPSLGQPIDLGAANGLWVVLEGRVDVFVSLRTEEGTLGARRHVLRVEQNEAIFGIDLSDAGFALLAQAAPGTRLVALEPHALFQRVIENDKDVSVLVETWITAISERYCKKRYPLAFVDASLESTLQVHEEGRAIVATSGVIWVTHTSGESWPLNDRRLHKVNGMGYFPISRFAWLQASPSSVLHTVTDFAVMTPAQFALSLNTFHKLIGELLLLEYAESLQEERTRFDQRSALNRALLDGALRKLINPIRKTFKDHADTHNCTHPVFITMQMIASELNIKITAPIQMLQNPDIADPVGLIARASSIRIRKVALKGSWWREQGGPLLCFFEGDGRPIAILSRNSGFAIYDSTTGLVTPLTEEVALQLNAIAYSLYRPFPPKVLKALDLLRFGLHGSTTDLLLIIGTGAAIGALAIVNPYVTGIIFDTLIPGAERNQLYQTAALLFVVAIAASMFMFVRGLAMLRLQGRMDAAVQAAVWDRLLGLPVSFFRDYSSGDLAQRSMGISQMREILTGSVLNAVLSGIFSIFSFALLFYYSAVLAFVATILVAFAIGVSLISGLAQLQNQRQVLDVSGKLSSRLLQFVGGIAKFKVSGTEGRAFSVWARDFSRQKEIAVRERKIANALSIFNSVYPVLALAAIFYANAHLFAMNTTALLSTGKFLAFLAAFTQFLVATLSLCNTFLTAVSILPIYERTKPILETIPEGGDGKSHPGILSGEIDISHVTFSYRGDNPPVLRDISLHIGAGQAVAFVGASGCGKSTLLRILLGFENPTSGMVYYDGQDLAGLDVKSVRRQIGVVLQTSRPINGSIFENIVGSAPLSVDDAWEACRMAGLDEDIRRMPMGLHTNIADGGGGISGGQRQRLMIARAIVGKPRILLFDEATSALDNRTQAIVSNSLSGLQATRIVIAHRLSTVKNMDKIFVLDKGHVVESGTYEELMRCEGIFYALAKRQLA
jgi:NHLM bacteriocin system ABC transporter ATP-binding protein